MARRLKKITFLPPTPTSALIRRWWFLRTATSCWAIIAPCPTTAAILALWISAISTAKPYSGTGRWTKWEECGENFLAIFVLCGQGLSSAKDAKKIRRVRKENPSDRNHLFRDSGIPAKISKIHSLEQECKLRLRSKTAESSEAKVTAPKANVTAKSFLILPSLAIRKFSPIPPTAARS